MTAVASGLEFRFARATLVSPRRALHVLERNVHVYRRRWILVLSGFIEPFFYLASIGVGLSRLVGTVTVDGHVITYPRFVAPGLLATAAMNGAIFDSTYNLFYKLKVAKTYDAMIATPIGVRDIALGEIGWALCRGLMYSTGFLVVMVAFGLVVSPWAVLCLPSAALVSLAFASLGSAVTSYMKAWQDLGSVTLAMIPLFLFSGTFFGLGVYPPLVAFIVKITPLYQGVVLVRSFDLGVVSPALIGHAVYLIVMAALAISVTACRFDRLLAP